MPHDLIPLGPALDGALALTDAEIEAIRDYAEAQHAASTRDAYDRDWRIFTAWCTARGACPLPADPPTVAGFLAAQASVGGVKASPPPHHRPPAGHHTLRPQAGRHRRAAD